MTVEQLREELSRLPGDLEVSVSVYDRREGEKPALVEAAPLMRVVCAEVWAEFCFLDVIIAERR